MQLFSDIRAWTFQQALPFWAENGLDRQHGGYVEALSLDGRDAALDFKRVRVIARQIYAYSHAEILGWPGARPVADWGFAYLLEKARRPDGGWVRTLTRSGGHLDATADLYDQAFVLFALGWRLRATGDGEARNLARETLAYIEGALRDPGGVGFLHALPPKGPRVQNPHMHLLEACLACHAASGDGDYLQVAGELGGLFRSHFFDRGSQTLGEYFDGRFVRLQTEQGRRIEPGHQFEWAWILHALMRASGEDFSPEIQALVGFAEQHGFDPALRAVRNVVRDDGMVLDGGSRTWPNTERMKAAVALFELNGTDPILALESSGRTLLDRYLAHTPGGGWIDAFDASGAAIASTMPASTLYHILLAFAETLRIEPALKR